MVVTLTRRSRFRNLCLATLALLPGCSCDKKPKWDPPGIPEVHRVELAPVRVYAATGEVFELRARVFGAAGRVIDVDAYPQISIEWSSATSGLFADATVNPVTIHAPSVPVTVNDITAKVVRHVVQEHGTDHSEVVSPPATIHIAALALAVSDELIVEHASMTPAAVVIDGRDASDCVADWTIAVAGKAALSRNLVPGCKPPSPELVFFARDRAMAFQSNPPLNDWSTGMDTREADPLPSPLLRSMGVIIGVDVDTGNVMTWAKEEALRAGAYLNRNRAGILLQTPLQFVHGDSNPIHLATACTLKPINDKLSKGNFDIKVDPDLFVLFVSDILNDIKGGACKPQYAGRVIYVSWKEYDSTTMAHELGHILGLADPFVQSGQGHANSIPGLYKDNLMWSSDDFAIRSGRNHFSVGQIFRMNMDTGSWFTNVVPNPITRDCQNDIGPGVCPALITDPG